MEGSFYLFCHHQIEEYKMRNIYNRLSVLIFFLVLLFTSCIKHDEENTSNEKPEGLFLNIAADAIAGYPEWGDLDTISKKNAIRAIEDYIDVYANTQVSTLLFNINYQRACFDSEVMESFWNLDNPDSALTQWPLNHWKIYKKGIDIYKVSLNHSRKKNISPWISFRMNDHHYFNDSTKINKLWWDNADYRLSDGGMFDYANEEVRNYYLTFIQEVLENYDIDGIELDWMRTHRLFKEGEAEKGIELINQFVGRVRQLTEAMAIKRGHPIRIAARVPSSPSIGRSYGLDGVAWVKAGYVDVLIPSNWYVPTNFDIPVEGWKNEIGSGFDYSLAPGADFAHKIASNKYLKSMKTNVETMRAFTVSAYSRGADAIYLFNNFDPSYKRKIIDMDGSVTIFDDKLPVLNEAGMLNTALAGPRSHVYTFNDPDTIPTRGEAPILTKGIEMEFDIYTGPQSKSGEYIIRIGLDAMDAFHNLKLDVKLNGISCQEIGDMPRDSSYQYDNSKIWDIAMNVSETSARVMQFKADEKSVKDGENRLSITNNQTKSQRITWLEAYIF
jgi:hypothetical protein